MDSYYVLIHGCEKYNKFDDIGLELYLLSEEYVDLIESKEYYIQKLNQYHSGDYESSSFISIEDFPSEFADAVFEYETFANDIDPSPFTMRFLYDKYLETLKEIEENEEHKRLERTY